MDLALTGAAANLTPISLGPFSKPRQVPETDTSALANIRADSEAFLQVLQQKHTTRIEALNEFKTQLNTARANDLKSKAPGYDARTLSPTTRAPRT